MNFMSKGKVILPGKSILVPPKRTGMALPVDGPGHME